MGMARSGVRRRLKVGACGRCARRLIRFLPSATVLPTLLISPVWGAEFQIVPALSVSQTYTDNVALAPAGQETSDWVTTVRPGVSLVYHGAKLNLSASYTAEILYRSGDEGINVNNQFSGGTTGSMELVPQTLFVDTNSTVSQYNNSVNGPLATSNINTTNNRSTVRTTVISPYLRHNFESEATGEVRYTYSAVSSDTSGSTFSDSGSNGINASLRSGPGYKLTGWSLNYSRQTIDYSEGQNNTFQSYSATARRLITPILSAVASVGYDNNDYRTFTGDSPSGKSWSAGINWTPTPRTNLTATTGRRYFGPSQSLNFSHRTRRTVWNAGYTEEITTTRSQFLAAGQADTATYLDALYISSIPDPVARKEAVQKQILEQGLPPTLLVPVNVFSNQVFLQKSWQAAVGLQGPIHTFMLNFYKSSRQAQSPGTPISAGAFAASSAVDQSGTGFLWTWRLTSASTSATSVGYTRSETPGTAEDNNSEYFRVALNHQFTPKLHGSVNYQRLKNDSSVATNNYTENQVAAYLQVRF